MLSLAVTLTDKAGSPAAPGGVVLYVSLERSPGSVGRGGLGLVRSRVQRRRRSLFTSPRVHTIWAVSPWCGNPTDFKRTFSLMLDIVLNKFHSVF